jgi:hypothetical protein
MPPVVTYVTTSDYPRDVRSPPANIPSLSIPVSPGKQYRFTATVVIHADSLGGWRLAPCVSDDTDGSWSTEATWDNAGYNGIVETDLSGNTDHADWGTGDDFTETVTMTGIFTAGSSATAITLQFAQATGHNTSTVLAGAALTVQATR